MRVRHQLGRDAIGARKELPRTCVYGRGHGIRQTCAVKKTSNQQRLDLANSAEEALIERKHHRAPDLADILERSRKRVPCEARSFYLHLQKEPDVVLAREGQDLFNDGD